MGVHDGHRQRVLRKFEKNGFAGLEEHEKLEIILFFSIPRPDTNVTAHELLEKYHTIAEVMDAPASELVKFNHVTERTYYLFKMIKEAYSTYKIEKTGDKSYLLTTDEFGTYFQTYLSNADVEKLVAMGLDNRGKILGVEVISEGDVNSTPLNSRKLIEFAMRSKASRVVIAHNHPGNVVFPSRDDIIVTQKVKEILQSVGVYLADHFIVCFDDYCSMANLDGYSKIFKS